MVSYYVILKSSMLHPRSDSRNWLRSSECWRVCIPYEPLHEKPTKWPLCQAKTQISLGIPGCPESLLCAQWEAKDPRFLHVDSEDSDQIGRMGFALTFRVDVNHRSLKPENGLKTDCLLVLSNFKLLWTNMQMDRKVVFIYHTMLKHAQQK